MRALRGDFPAPFCPVLTALVLFAGAAPGRSQLPLPDHGQAVHVDGRPLSGGPDHDRMHYDREASGVLWARGESYKARFDPDGLTYFPLFGKRATRHFPVAFRLESVTGAEGTIAFERAVPATREADRVTYARGALIEVYEMSPKAIEQRLVFDALPARGDLVIRYAVSSELAAREAAEGLELFSELGAVRYGRAVAIDAAGARASCGTAFSGDGIEIRVPGSFLAGAELPLTIDPLVSTFSIDTFSNDNFAADVAYDVTNDRFLVVYEEADPGPFDHDVYTTFVSAGGVPTFNGYVDMSSENYAHPRVANNNYDDQFLIVMQVGPSGARWIRGRSVDAATGGFGAFFLISGAGDEHVNPDVGGDPYDGQQSYYCVVWEKREAGTSTIVSRIATTSGTVFASVVPVSSGTDPAQKPSVSKSDATRAWDVVWQQEDSPSDHDIYGALIFNDGWLSVPAFPIATENSIDQTNSAVSSPLESNYHSLAVWEEDDGSGQVNLAGALLDSGAILDSIPGLSAMEFQLIGDPGLIDRDQVGPSVDSDGHCFVVAYSESTGDFGAGNYDVYMATFDVVSGLHAIGDLLHASESHVRVSFSSTDEGRPQVTSAPGTSGVSRRFMAVWDDTVSATNHNIEGALYSCSNVTIYCAPGYEVAFCPCSNSPDAFGKGCNNSSNTGGAFAVPSGTASVQQDSLAFTSFAEKPTALSIFLQGNGVVQDGVVFGQGRRCVGGSLKRLYVKTASNGMAMAPQGSDPPIHVRSAMLGDAFTAGDTRHYMVYYRDPIVLGGCPMTSTFNATQAVQVHWLP